MKLHYINEANRRVEYILYDWDAAVSVASVLVNAPIDIDYVYYEDETGQGVFNLNTFEKC